MKNFASALAGLWLCAGVYSQVSPDTLRTYKEFLDSTYIEEVEQNRNVKLPDKVLHAEPLYVDLIRDLGARKGEKEWNLGMGFTDMHHFDKYEALIEYEFAPVNRVGLEVEVPITVWVLPKAGTFSTTVDLKN